MNAEHLFIKPDSQSISSIFHFDQLNYENIVYRSETSVDKLRQPQFGCFFYCFLTRTAYFNNKFLPLLKHAYPTRLLIAKFMYGIRRGEKEESHAKFKTICSIHPDDPRTCTFVANNCYNTIDFCQFVIAHCLVVTLQTSKVQEVQ